MKICFCFLLMTLYLNLLSCKKKPETSVVIEKQIQIFDELKKADWLIGSWGFTNAKGTLTETWHQKNDSTFAGQTYFITGKDTVFSESICLEERNQKLYYVPTVSDQNNEKPVSFELKSATATELLFENPTHDFPQKIVYHLIGTDSLIATISGLKNGKEAEENFTMKQMK